MRQSTLPASSMDSNIRMGCVGVLVRVFSVLLAVLVHPSTTQTATDFALNQPAYQLSMWSTHPPSWAVNGNTNRNFGTGYCTHSGTDSYVYPWWTVKLKKWVILTSFIANGRSDPYDYPMNYNLGRFWNDALPSVVTSGSMVSSPLRDVSFVRVFSHNAQLSTNSPLNVTIASVVAIGRYFSVETNNVGQQVMLCQVQVFGATSVLSGSKAISIVSDYSGYLSFNSSLLTDEREDTCLTFFGANKGQSVLLFTPLTVASNLCVLVFMTGTVRIDTGNGRQCTPGMSLRIFQRRLKAGGMVQDTLCALVDMESCGVSTTYHFSCTCPNCMSDVLVWLKGGDAASYPAVAVCEVLVFPV